MTLPENRQQQQRKLDLESVFTDKRSQQPFQQRGPWKMAGQNKS